MSPLDKILLFGDQTVDLLPAISDLNRLVSRSQNLKTFFEKRRFPTFVSLLELATAVEEGAGEGYHEPALRAALLCISQLGHVIIHLESEPQAICAPVSVLGICTGLLAGAAVACCQNLTELLAIADEVVQLAFRIGLAASQRSEAIDDSTSGSWATLFSNADMDVAVFQKALRDFNEASILEPSKSAYLSAIGTNSLVVSGPPSTTADLLGAGLPFSGCKKLSLPISAAFHAGHLDPVPLDRITNGLSGRLLERRVAHAFIFSPSSGRVYTGETFREILMAVVDDIFQNPISFEKCTRGLSGSLCQPTSLVCFGPVNSANTIKQNLHALGIDIIIVTPAVHVLKTTANANSIAIVGMAARLPGSETLEEFWRVLEDGRDLHEKIRPDRFDVDTHCDPTGKARNTSHTPYGVFIDRPGYFDTRLFNMSPREAAQTDPQQRLLLLTTYEALEMAGYAPNATPSTSTRRIGSFMGQTGDDWREVNASQNVDTYFITGGIRAFGPGRLNYHFGWEGPSYSVDTACSSSAASIQLACSALLARECDMAVGGGANFLTASDLFAGLSRGGFLSKTGGCKTFDHEADGYVRADAVGVVVMKRLDDALADRDNILAVIQAAVTNHSAEAVSITHPHAETQERLFTSALNQAGIHPHDIDYAELHGTGTQAGDATESRSVTNVLARGRHSSNPLYIGTVKPNLGHGEAASGVTSLIKSIMMLRKSMIPPHVGIKGRINQKLPPLAELNTHISFGKTPLLPRADRGGKRRILINNFDAAGGNTSMVIEDPPVVQTHGADARLHHVIAVSGKTPLAILNNSKRLLEFVRQNPNVRLEDIAYTTTARRMHHLLRHAHTASSVESLGASLEKSIAEEKWGKKSGSPPPVVFLFTGQGSHYKGMASVLLKTNATFRDSLLECNRLCVSHGFDPFLHFLADDECDISAATPAQMQLAIVSIELAMADWWKSIGVFPSLVLGHSLGEYPALHCAGVLSLSDCLYMVGVRAGLLAQKCTPGTHAMLAVQASVEEAERRLKSLGADCADCEVACDNGPSATVLSGPVDQIAKLQERLRDVGGVKSKMLEGIEFAFHSSQMDPVLDQLEAIAKRLHLSAPSVPIASTVLGRIIEHAGDIDAAYFRKHARDRVEFLSALEAARTLLERQTPLWIEHGPTPINLGLAGPVLGSAAVLLPSLKRNESDWKVLATSAAKAYGAGLDIDWKEFHRPYEQSLRLLELPTYAFDLKNYWIQYEGDWAVRKGEVSASSKAELEPPALPTFSTTSLHRIESQLIDDSQATVTFASDASEPKLNKALRGHLVNGAGLCPSSVYADMAFTAARYLSTLTDPGAQASSIDVRNMDVHKPLLIKAGETHQIIRVTATRLSATEIEVHFSSQDGQTSEDHAHCLAVLGDGDRWKAEWAKTAYLIESRVEHLVQASTVGKTHKILQPMVYKLFAALVDYDIRYQGLKEVYMDSHLYEAAANVKFNTTDADGTFTYSPFWIDSLAHLSGFVLNGADTTPPDAVFISHGWGSMKIVGELSAAKEYRSYVRMQPTEARGVMAGDVYFFEGSQIIAVCEGLKFQKIKRSILNLLMPSTSHTAPTIASAIKAPPNEPRSLNDLWRSGTLAGAADKRVDAPGIKSAGPFPRAASSKLSPIQTLQTDFDTILKVIASEIGVDVAEIGEDIAFADLGVDSLLSLSITAKLGEQLSQSIPASLFHECPTAKELREYFSSSGECTGALDTPSSTDSESDCPSPSMCSSGFETPTTAMAETPDSRACTASSDVFRRIIATEVGVDMSEIDDDIPLADLGVDSLLTLSILAAIKAETGKVLSPSFLIDNPTLGAIHTALGNGGTHSALSRQLSQALETVQTQIDTPKANAVLLQGSPTSPSPSLFLLPDGSGSASSYVHLPKLDGFRGAVYGLNSPFLASPEAFTLPIEDVASLFLAEIRRLQPAGPYHLAGWSIGGTYAFEIASQLIRRHGQRVDTLVLIDAPCPGALPPLPLETIALLKEVGAFDGMKRGKLGAVRDGVKAHFAGSVGALKRYRPRAMSRGEAAGIGAVVVVWARRGVWETVGREVGLRQYI
ncbi:putative polyketide synthase [Podospora conica]|nr:putative polyketide synthase [Schizothecium conicum]